MAIKGLTDRGASFPVIGTLRKGGKKVNDKKPGPDLTYFRFDSGDAEAVEAFNKRYPHEPQVISVLLPFRTAVENFEAWKEQWVAGGLKHRCDGETTELWLDQSGQYKHSNKPCPGGCKQVGRLSVVIPDLKRLALVTVLTTSIHDILELTQNLQALEALRGDLRGIPLLLRRVPRKISTPTDNGGRARREKWLLHVEAQPQWVELQLAAAQEAALPKANIEQRALPAGPDEYDYDGDDYEDSEEDAPSAEPPAIPQTKPSQLSERAEVEQLLYQDWLVDGRTADGFREYRNKFLAKVPVAGLRMLVIWLSNDQTFEAFTDYFTKTHAKKSDKELQPILTQWQDAAAKRAQESMNQAPEEAA